MVMALKCSNRYTVCLEICFLIVLITSINHFRNHSYLLLCKHIFDNKITVISHTCHFFDQSEKEVDLTLEGPSVSNITLCDKRPYIRHFRDKIRVFEDAPSKLGYENGSIILIIVNFHYDYFHSVDYLDTVNFVELAKLYRYDFDVVYIAPHTDMNHKVIGSGLPPMGYYSYHSVSVALDIFSEKEKYIYHGVFLMNDDSCVDPTHLNTYNHSRSLLEPYVLWNERLPWFWNGLTEVKSSFYSAILELQGNMEISASCKISIDTYYMGRSDFFYLPRHDVSLFLHIETIMFKHKVFLEMAVPTAYGCFTRDVFINCNEDDQDNIQNCTHVHPVKLGRKGNRELCLNRIKGVDFSRKPPPKEKRLWL